MLPIGIKIINNNNIEIRQNYKRNESLIASS